MTLLGGPDIFPNEPVEPVTREIEMFSTNWAGAGCPLRSKYCNVLVMLWRIRA